MAFYNRKMAANKALTKAWRAGHRRKLNEDDEICLPEICAEIAHWMRRGRCPRNRLSLRSFSVLLSGAIRIYRDQVNLLLKDAFKCSVFKKSTALEPVYPMTSQDSASSGKSSSLSNSDRCKSIANDLDDSESSAADYEGMSDDDDESTVFTVTPNNNQESEQSNELEEEIVEKRHQSVQTSQTPEYHRGFDPNLPFGYVIVHDTYHSRIPSKILCCSLNENIKFLSCTPMD